MKKKINCKQLFENKNLIVFILFSQSVIKYILLFQLFLIIFKSKQTYQVKKYNSFLFAILNYLPYAFRMFWHFSVIFSPSPGRKDNFCFLPVQSSSILDFSMHFGQTSYFINKIMKIPIDKLCIATCKYSPRKLIRT